MNKLPEWQKEPPPVGPRILIILMGSLGDVTRGLCLVDAIKDHWKGARLSWLVEPECEAIVRLHPHIDQVLVFDRKHWVTGLKYIKGEFARNNFEIVLDLQRHFKSGFFSFLTKSKRRIGFHRKNSKEFNWIFNKEFVPRQHDETPKLQHYLGFLKLLDIAVPEKLSFGLEGVRLLNLRRELREQLFAPYVALILGSSWETKDWTEEGYSKLIGELLKIKMILVVLLGDRSKQALASRLVDANPSDRLVNLTGVTTLKELVGIVNSAKVCVGPDSGPAHIAGAVGTPHITLFGPTPIERNVPYKNDLRVVSAYVDCSPCGRRTCPGMGEICMKRISVEQVLGKIEEALKEGANGL